MRQLPVVGSSRKLNFPIRLTNQAENAAAKAHQDFFKALFEITPGPSWSAMVRNDKSKSIDGVHGCCGDKLILKSFTPNQINDIDQQFIDQMGLEFSGKFDQYLRDWLRDTYDSPNLDDSTIWKQNLGRMINQTVDWANDRTVASYKRLQAMFSQWAESNPVNFNRLPVTADVPWVQELSNNGFNLVKNKIFNVLGPDIKLNIIQAQQALTPWDVTTELLYNKFGRGQLWQWQRLVRSEMAMAIDTATREQYKENGVQAVKWSVSNKACPICLEIGRTNNGYYAIEKAPRVVADTHPNCTCLVIEVYRLPKGIEI